MQQTSFWSRTLLWAARHKWALLVVVILVLFLAGSGLVVAENVQASQALKTAKKLDDSGQYAQAKQLLQSARRPLVRGSVQKQLTAELQRNQHLSDTKHLLDEVALLLKEHKTSEAQKLLQSLPATTPDANAGNTNQITALQQTIKQQTNTGSGAASSTGAAAGKTSGGSASSGGNTSGTGGSSGNTGSGAGSTPPPPGPLTSLSVVSFTASSAPSTASKCNISDALTFSANGSGAVTATWWLYSSKSTSGTNNANNFTFSAAGNQSDSFNFNGTQGLEAGDSYRIGVTIASVSSPSIFVTAGPITISSCAAPPSLAAEQVSAFMTSITPGTVSINQFRDTVFPNECSVEVTTPYSVNSSGTVEAIVMATSSYAIGYTYYDANGVTSFTGSGSTSDTSYLRLPHLPGGAHYNVTVKLVEVSAPNTVYATTAPVDMACS